MREYALVLLVTAAVTYLLVPLVRRVAVATGAMHAPRARDVHTKPTPLLGGLAMYGGLIAGLLIASRLAFLQDPFQAAGSRTQTGLLLAGALIVVVGFLDDRWGLSAVGKLAGQVAAAGIVVWSGQSLPWLPTPNGHIFSLEPDLSVTLTILLVVITINAINFIDGLDGLAAGIVAVAALSFLVYSYWLVTRLGNPSQSLPATSSALLAGMCLGFLPHNFYPARIFMGDIGAMLLGLMLAYGPISSTASLDPAVFIDYAQAHVVNRFGTMLPLLVPIAIFLVPYADFVMAVTRRIRRGVWLMTADREHLHHRLLGIGHSYRQSVLIMWLWAALFSAMVVSLSLVRTQLPVLAAVTVAAVLTLLPVTMPSMRPWRLLGRSRRVPPSAPALSPAPASSPAPVPSRAPDGSRARRPARVPPPAAAPYPRAANGAYPQAANGTYPQAPNGTYPQAANGAYPQAPNGAYPQAPNGAYPQAPNGAYPQAANGTYPQAPNGAYPQAPNGIPGPGPGEHLLRPFPGDAAERTDPPAR